MKTGKVSVQDKVPVLGDPPLIGGLGRSRIEIDVPRYLYVMTTIKMVDSRGQPAVAKR